MPELSIGRLRGGYCVSWSDADTGKRRRYQLAALTRKEAEAEALAVYRQHSLPVGASTVSEVWNAYRLDLGDRPTAETMLHTGKAVLPHFGALPPTAITADHCRAYTASRSRDGVKVGTIWTELGHLRSALHWAATKARIIEYAPHIERPAKPAPKDRWLTHSEIDRLLESTRQPHVRLAVLLMLSTAGRIGAILDLTWDRVDLDRGQIDLRVDTTGPRKGRAVVPINAGLRAALSAAQEVALSDYVVEWGGERVGSIKTGFRGACNRAGLEQVTPHVLRHTAGVHMAAAGIPMARISQYLGHSSTSVTERVYARFAPDHLRDAADVIDFSRLRKVQ